MTENRRIFWNVIATYGRSLYALAVGLITARWALSALGVVDYGLYGVVGGLLVFIGFLNGTLSSAIGRFYAISIGEERKSDDKARALDECRRWFNTALSIHSVVPVVLIAVGYPIGSWAIQNFLTIPPERIEDCLWVFRLSCITSLVGMVNVPFSAMYEAKQYIAELTIYGYVTTTLNALFLYYMITHPGSWLVKYALWGSAMSVIPAVIICVRSVFIFPECRIKLEYMWDLSKLRQTVWFAWWNFCGMVCGVLRINGVAILVNKCFGPRVNAANALAINVNSHASSLAGSLMGAFFPAITTAFGSGDLDRMKALSYRASKLGPLLLMIFIIPLLSELRPVLEFWLKTPPEYTAYLCFVAIVDHFMDVNTLPHCVAINASGRVKEYQQNMIKISILTLPVAIITVWLGGGIYALGVVLICVRISISLRRVYYARLFAGLSARYWASRVVFPLSIAFIVAGGFSFLPHLFFEASFYRICITTVTCEAVLIPLSWFVLLTGDERQFLIEKFGPCLRPFWGGRRMCA